MAATDDDKFFNTPDEAEATDESNASMSLMGGVARPDELPEADLELDGVKTDNKFFSQGTLLLVMLFVIASGSLYAMRVSQGDLSEGAVSKDIEAKIEQALAKLSKQQALPDGDPLGPGKLKVLFQDTEDIIAMFASDPTERQVPLAYVKKNPFVLPVYRKVADETKPDDSTNSGRVKLEEKLNKLKRDLDRLELQSVMLGSRPVAIIDGDFFQPGENIGNFKLVAINDLSVVLEAEGHQFTLEIEKPDQGSRRGGRRR